AARLADTIQSITALPVELWDESFSTQEAQAARRAAGASRRRRRGHQDELAATIILQSYLDAKQN
ncbi:MAG TPA: Holliday junction resolvase RuvX, partial [Anaerolineales bacterium]|nr:Holliday junction resolvase RuvX [Anaerolineales bacterium]